MSSSTSVTRKRESRNPDSHDDPYEALHIYEADEPNRQLIPALMRSEYAEEIFDDTFPFGVGITGWAGENREPVLSNQAHLDPRVAKLSPVGPAPRQTSRSNFTTFG